MISTDEFRQETVNGRQLYTEDSAQTVESTRMDIALLKEQYNWIKEKQRQETRVVVFKNGKYRVLSSCEEVVAWTRAEILPI